MIASTSNGSFDVEQTAAGPSTPQSAGADAVHRERERQRASEVRVAEAAGATPGFRPIIRLFSDDVMVHRVEGLSSHYDTEKLPLVALSFDYGGTIIRASHVDGPQSGVDSLGGPAANVDDSNGELDDPDEDVDGISLSAIKVNLDLHPSDIGPGKSPFPARSSGNASHVVRDLAAEGRVRRFLESFGAVELDCLDDYAAPPGVEADYVVRCEGTVHDFCAFTADVVPKLRALGWRVDVAEDHKYRTLEATPRWYAEIEPEDEDGDWFSLELGVDLDGRRINMLPALVELLEQMSEGQGLHELVKRMPRVLAVPVDEGLYLTLPAERMRTLLRVLAELYDGRKTPEGNAFRFPETRAAAIEELDVMFKTAEAPLEWSGGEALRHRAAKLHETPAEITPPAGLKAELRSYQREGVAWLQHLRSLEVGGILADDMGLGKTLQTIAHVTLEKEAGRLTKPVLIVAPTSLIANWVREFGKFSPGINVVPLHGAQRHERFAEATTADVVVTSYPLVCRDEEKFEEMDFHIVILDEAQTIKNMKSRVHQAIRGVQSDHRLCLTGTPVENHLGELWALMDFLNPGLLGDEVSFGRFYRVPIEKAGNQERLGALRELLAPYILRRTKIEVAKELPPKTELVRPIELRGQQRELYESIRVAAHAEVRSLIRKKGLAASTIPILGALTKLRQVCCDPRLVKSEASSLPRESAKYEAFEDLLGTLRSEGRRILVFSQFTTMLKLIARGLDQKKEKYALLTGDTQDRAQQVDIFQGGDVDVFLISLRAGGTGLTLTRADAVIHYDPWWNPAVQAQATDRAYRIGQTCPVFVYNLYVAGSVEERMLRLQKRKRSVADAILGNAAPSAALTEDDLEVLFAPLGA